MEKILVFVVVALLAMVVVLGVFWNSSNNAYMELLEIQTASQERAVASVQQEYLQVVADILEQEQVLLNLELTREEKELLKKAQKSFEEKNNIQELRYYSGTMAWIIQQHQL